MTGLEPLLFAIESGAALTMFRDYYFPNRANAVLIKQSLPPLRKNHHDAHDDRYWARSAMIRNTLRESAKRILRPLHIAARDRTGSSAVEFALVFPVLLAILFAIIKLGLALNNYIELTNGVRAGARQLAIGRASTTPYADARNRVFTSAPNLTTGNVTITLRVAGTPCGGDGACQTALAAAAGGTSSVTATYPCDLSVMGINYAPSCTLSAQTTERIE